MIYIGLTGWGDHDTIYQDLTNKNEKLYHYGAHFPIVELDATYYSVQPERNIRKWIKETPDNFKFIVKIHQALTGHAPIEDFAENRQVLIDQFKRMLLPMHTAGKLGCLLIQFPPWYECSTVNINYIIYLKKHFEQFPLCVEFRHDSWFTPDMKEHTLHFLYEQGIMHSVCDEPQAGHGSIPFVNRLTHKDALVRLHGRNVLGWTKKDMSDQEWRDVRYLYDYNESELKDLAKELQILDKKARDVYVVFNNNSGGHAAGNAMRMCEILNLEYSGLNYKQLKLF
ncbi:DUF72 domain-containing protein [Macrococcoides caseolyticum]|uniref:DUF72 domain-containing protein n=1 Tax=Macrococcoides caseolyticum TaxID=69966 RepID=UPI001F28D22F|nr:DUF72 domain-containing protein [Macrococcus caseolyticus]MCE4955798.1 DUF72 domain-containing protein [Macrococcus caseolyticus]